MQLRFFFSLQDLFFGNVKLNTIDYGPTKWSNQNIPNFEMSYQIRLWADIQCAQAMFQRYFRLCNHVTIKVTCNSNLPMQSLRIQSNNVINQCQLNKCKCDPSLPLRKCSRFHFSRSFELRLLINVNKIPSIPRTTKCAKRAHKVIYLNVI